jgi:hypothetical protein
MTFREVTEKAARIAYPNLPQEAIERIGVAIWNASPTGELYHVLDLNELIAHNPEQVPEYVKAIRNVEAVAAEWKLS